MFITDCLILVIYVSFIPEENVMGHSQVLLSSALSAAPRTGSITYAAFYNNLQDTVSGLYYISYMFVYDVFLENYILIKLKSVMLQ